VDNLSTVFSSLNGWMEKVFRPSRPPVTFDLLQRFDLGFKLSNLRRLISVTIASPNDTFVVDPLTPA
jgi:hypothetical protein